MNQILESWKIIHHALHSDVAVVTIEKDDYPILKAGNGCRYVDYCGVRIMQQNKYKNSNYAKRARAGEKISWAMTQPTWTLIDDYTTSLNSPKTRPNANTKREVPANTGATEIQKGSQAARRKAPRGFWGV